MAIKKTCGLAVAPGRSSCEREDPGKVIRSSQRFAFLPGCILEALPRSANALTFFPRELLKFLETLSQTLLGLQQVGTDVGLSRSKRCLRIWRLSRRSAPSFSSTPRSGGREG
jgi:hypothetical protein